MDEFLDFVVSDNDGKVREILETISSKVFDKETALGETSLLDFKITDLEDAFVEAAFAGSINCLQALHKYVPDVNCQGRLRDSCPDYLISPLRAAVEADRVEVVHWLCTSGARPNRRECLYSINYDDVISGPNFSNHCAVSCYVPLHFAQSRACAETLLKHGADINAQDCMSKTPLSMATLDGRLVVMETLCENGAHVGLGSTWGATPLVYAQYARRKTDRISATEILCRYGACVNFQDKNGRSALHVTRDPECLRVLLSYGGDPSLETIFGKTPVVMAAEAGNWEIVRMLFDAQPRVELGLLARGVALCNQLPLDVFSWLLRASREVRELKHLCRCVIRTTLVRTRGNLDDAIITLPLPTRVKLYLALLQHAKN
ncbi:ankyrin repeat and SOCS box protein 8 [Nematostella vectensis]|uniref:ankyrin repeat and SOCS box protein 8 n=1 Tax=Nematostella vectensis TaxID=45351 RepID=UPI0020777041|nr:ankyrin repeat and SOCS box protein 8 [Nematostella vectensis]